MVSDSVFEIAFKINNDSGVKQFEIEMNKFRDGLSGPF
jgi:hypothetical protein